MNLKPVAIGIVTGLLSAFVLWLCDCQPWAVWSGGILCGIAYMCIACGCADSANRERVQRLDRTNEYIGQEAAHGVFEDE